MYFALAKHFMNQNTKEFIDATHAISSICLEYIEPPEKE